MTMSRMLKTSLVALGLSLAVTQAEAGDLKLSTVRVDLNDKQPNNAMVITNVGTTPSLVQFRVLNWAQSNQGDELTATTDVIANPPIAEIAAGARQMVRIGYNGKLQSETERTYRLFIEEVPKKDRERQQAVETYLKISVPVFVASLSPSAPRISGFIAQSGSEGPKLVLQNTSNSHVRFLSFALSDGQWNGAQQKGLFYILPGAKVELSVDPAERRAASANTVELTTETGSMKLPLQRK